MCLLLVEADDPCDLWPQTHLYNFISALKDAFSWNGPTVYLLCLLSIWSTCTFFFTSAPPQATDWTSLHWLNRWRFARIKDLNNLPTVYPAETVSQLISQLSIWFYPWKYETWRFAAFPLNHFNGFVRMFWGSLYLRLTMLRGNVASVMQNDMLW